MYTTFTNFMMAVTVRSLPKVRQSMNIPDNVFSIVKQLLESGWITFAAVCALLALGAVAFSVALASFLLTPAGLVVIAILAAAGYGAYQGLKLLYKFRCFPIAIWRTGLEVKSDYEHHKNDPTYQHDLLIKTVDMIVNRSLGRNIYGFLS